MVVDYISDLHIDFYTSSCTYKKIKRYFNTYIRPKGEVLIIAGDLSHYNIQAYYFVQIALEHYKKVFVISGNHEYYNISKRMNKKFNTLFSRVNDLKEMLSSLKDVYFLDWEVVVYNGIKFGGTMAWYDDSYYSKLPQPIHTFPSSTTRWFRESNDSRKIPQLTDFKTLFDIEIKKVKSVLEQIPDIMITHICPVADPCMLDAFYKYNTSSSWYIFDGLALLEKYKPRFWVYGHLHDRHEVEIYHTKLLRNPMGYNSENIEQKGIKSFVVNSKKENE